MAARTLLVTGFLGIILADLAGCSYKGSSNKPAARSNEAAAPAVVSSAETAPNTEDSAAKPLGSLKGREHLVTFYSTPIGPRFTVSTLDGKMLGEQLSVEELRAQLPDVYETVKSSIAQTGGHLDASARTEPAQRPTLDASLGRGADR